MNIVLDSIREAPLCSFQEIMEVLQLIKVQIIVIVRHFAPKLASINIMPSMEEETEII